MKRILAFVVLMVVGFLLLYQFVGEDLLPSAAADDTAPQRPAGAAGIDMRQGQIGARVEQRGPLRFPQVREIPQPDGSVLKEMVFVLHAEDSRPLGQGLQQLDDVDVTFFDDGARIAVLEAVRALVELGTDDAGKASLAADKEFVMTEVVLAGLEGTRLEGFRLEMARANALVDANEINLYTPTPTDPVRLSFTGDPTVTLEGKGLQARMPRDPDGALQRVDIAILGDPVVSTPGASVTGRGRLHYTEDLRRGTGQLSLAEGVVVRVDRGAGLAGAPGAGAGGVTISGDQLLGWLARRGRSAARDPLGAQAVWRMLKLTGAPATVVLDGLRVATPQLTLLPGPLGDPFWITASGGASSIEEIATADRPRRRPPFRGGSPRRIHLWQAGEHLGAVHRAFGFPQWTLGPLAGTRVVAFEGATHLEVGARTVDASRGLHVFQLDPEREGVIARGFGEVDLVDDAARSTGAADRLVAHGNDGFLLLAERGAERVTLGPPAGAPGWQQHTYELTRGALTAAGTGACRIEREAERTRVELRAPDREITCRLLDRNATLTGVRWLRAEATADELLAFDLDGLPATATFDRRGETFVATAPRLVQTDRASLRMLPPDPADPARWHGLAETDRLPRLARDAAATPTGPARRMATTAPRIDLHHLGRDHILVDAVADAEVPARITATIEERPGEPPVTATLEARRLRALPYAVPPAIAGFHVGSDSAAALLPFVPWTMPWILGDEVEDVHIEHPGEGTFEGRAHRLLLTSGAQAGLLIGDPETMTPATVTRRNGRGEVTARGAQVRIRRTERANLWAFRAFPKHSAFLLPEIELHRHEGGGPLAHLRATCQGDIEMRPDAVLFGGPVTAWSLAPDGSIPDDGLGIVGQQLRMELHPDSGEVRRVVGSDVVLDWSRVSGRAAEIELDVRRSRCIATDPRGARVELANGLAVTSRQITVDWRTLAFSADKAVVEPRAEREVLSR